MIVKSEVLFVSIFLLVLISGFTRPTPPKRAVGNQQGDGDLEQSGIDHLRRGEGYYSSMEKELRSRFYAVRPFWNFRLPTLAMFVSRFKTNLPPRIILMALAGILELLWLIILFKEAGWPSVAMGVVLFTLILRVAGSPNLTVCHDVWVGILIALSIGFYAYNRPASIVFGLLALSLRIHACAFVVVMGACALWERKYREFLVWSAGLILFGCYVAIHAHFASQHATDMDAIKSWEAHGGWSFVMATTSMLLPDFSRIAAVTGPLLIISILSLTMWNHPSARRAAMTMLAFICAFMVMGNPDNDYWGLLYSPLYAVGLAYSPKAVRDMIRGAENEKVQTGIERSHRRPGRHSGRKQHQTAEAGV